MDGGGGIVAVVANLVLIADAKVHGITDFAKDVLSGMILTKARLSRN